MSVHRILIQLLGIALCVSSCVASAKDTAGVAMSCHDYYARLDSRHAQTMAAKAIISGQLYHEGLWAIEDEMFVALQQCPTDALLFSLMAEVQMTLGQAPFAVAYARKAVDLDASVWQANYALGTALCMTGDCASGLDYLRYASKLEPANLRLQLNLCSAYAWAGRHAQVVASCSAVIDSGDKDVTAQAYYLRSKANKALGHRHEAEQDMQQAERLGFNSKRDVLQVISPESVSPSLQK
jgi:predicted Zn-dependent protease